MSKDIYEVYTLDEDGEAIGVHFFCQRCAPDTAEVYNDGACDGTVCEMCGVLLVEWNRDVIRYD